MRKKLRNRLMISGGFIVILCSLLFIWVKGYLFTFNGIQEAYHEDPVVSPNSAYSAKVSYEYYGGAAGGVNAVVEITDHSQQDLTKTVYYAAAQSEVSVEWGAEDPEILFISNKNIRFPNDDRSIQLNVTNDIYHDTGRACRSILLKGTYTNCYSRD